MAEIKSCMETTRSGKPLSPGETQSDDHDDDDDDDHPPYIAAVQDSITYDGTPCEDWKRPSFSRTLRIEVRD